MRPSSSPRRAIVLGTSLSGKIASMVLAGRLDVSMVVGPRPTLLGSNPGGLSGKHAHSHAFLPRFIKEIDAVAPFLSKAFADGGLRRVSASRAFRGRAPLYGTRLKAMRWQIEDVVTQEFNKLLPDRLSPTAVSDADMDGDSFVLRMEDGRSVRVDDDTLVVDAMGANSPLMRQLFRKSGDPTIEDSPSNIGYVTQIFRLRSRLGGLLLPDPVADCSDHLGRAFVTLYAGADRWFSVTLAWDIRNKSTLSLLQDTPSVVEFASRSPCVARWIAAAEPIGPSRRYMNPRNRWSLPILSSRYCPENYIAIGDALVTTAPTLGAGCSWLASHVRVLAESLGKGDDWRTRFLEGVATEQRGFFELSVATGAPVTLMSPPELRPRKGPIHVLLSPIIERERHAMIREHVMKSSTL